MQYKLYSKLCNVGVGNNEISDKHMQTLCGIKETVRLKNKLMIKTILTLILIFLFNNFLKAQIIDSNKCDCDSILKSKIDSRFSLTFAGRDVKTLVKSDNSTCETGMFSFVIWVNRNGEVIKAEFNTKISSQISDKLKTILMDAAMKAKFMDMDDAPSKQKGSITFFFRLKDEN